MLGGGRAGALRFRFEAAQAALALPAGYENTGR